MLGRRADALGQAAEDLRRATAYVPDDGALVVGVEQRLGAVERGAQRHARLRLVVVSLSSRRGAQEEREGGDGGERRAGGDRHQTTSPSAPRRRR